MPVLPLDAAVSIVGSATSWEIDVEIRLFGITFRSVRAPLTPTKQTLF